MNGRWILACCCALGALVIGCDDEADPGPSPPPLNLPDEPERTEGPGHFSAAQRGIALDVDDFAVITEDGAAGIGAAELGTAFQLLVINRPYVDWRASTCVQPDEAAMHQPRQTADALVAALQDRKGVTFDRVAVNVDLLSPARRSLIFVCYGENNPRFDIIPHRQAIVDAFVELAGMANIESITVGLEMNRYYHLSTEDGRRLRDDYSNFVTLYRQVYAAIKAANPSVKVGPGLSWAVFQRRTVPEIAEELDLDETGMEAFYRAWQRTIEPLLTAGGQATADFVGISMIPFQAEEPFDGVPNPEGEAREDVLEHYRRIPIFANGLPVALPQVDWAVGSGSANLKAPFLAVLKEGLSHVNVAWAAWRRTADLPDTQDASPCAKYTEAREPTLAYPQDFCSAGLVSESGARRDVLDEFLTDP